MNIRPRTTARARFGLVVASDQHPHTGTGPAQRGLAALIPMLEQHDGAWVAAKPTAEDGMPGPMAYSPDVCDQDLADHRHGQCAATLAPIYHGLAQPPLFKGRWQQAYDTVNDRYAQRIAAIAAPRATVWIHDLELQLVPGRLRRLRPDLRIGFCLRSPFPPAELFTQLPDATDVLTGLLGADLIGFAQQRSADNFLDIAQYVAGHHIDGSHISASGRTVATTVTPMPVDSGLITGLAARPRVEARAVAIRRALRNPHAVLLSLGSWDAADGTLQRLDAFARLVAAGHLAPQDTALIHLAPQCPAAPTAQQLRQQVERRIAQINGDHSSLGHCVVHYQHGDLDPAEQVAYYLAADVLITGAIADGGLAAQEYAAARHDGRGAIILADASGVADLAGALNVNPHDIDAFAMAIAHTAASAGHPSADMHTMHALVSAEDIDTWATAFLAGINSGGRQAEPLARYPRSPLQREPQPPPSTWRTNYHHQPQQERQTDREPATDRDHTGSRFTVATPHP